MDNDTRTNESTPFNKTDEETAFLSFVEDFSNIYYGTQAAFAAPGTVINLWFLVAILSSSDLRSRLRNKIICNVLLFCLADTLLTFPANALFFFTEAFNSAQFGCTFISLANHLMHTQDFLNNWLIVSLLVVFIAQIQDFNPAFSWNLTSKCVTVGTYLILISPWLAAVVIVPSVINTYHVMYSIQPCSSPLVNTESFIMLKITDTAVPTTLALLLLIIAAVLKLLAARRNLSNDGLQDGLIGASMKVDPTCFYVLAVGMCLICDFLLLLSEYIWTYVFDYGFYALYRFYLFVMLMSDARVLLTPFVLLFLEDIRERIKSWRPWRRVVPGLLPYFHFNKEEHPTS